jgi:AdoMet-dependent heme synthase
MHAAAPAAPPVSDVEAMVPYETPHLVAWEVTRSCYLNCRHCRAAARHGPYLGELSTEDAFRLLEQFRELGRFIVILTGGEPMMRDDIWEIARYGSNLGLKMVMAPCGALVTEETVARMKASGIERISLSIDGATAASHDDFRRVAGAFDMVLKAARVAKQHGMPFQVNTTITQHNVGELEAILKLAVELGAVAFHPFLLVPTGRGAELASAELPPEEYERVLNWVYDQTKTLPLHFKPTCAPHYHRIKLQRETEERRLGLRPRTPKRASRPLVLGGPPAGDGNGGHPDAQAAAHTTAHAAAHPGHPGGRPGAHPGGLDGLSKGCMGGSSFAFVSHRGDVQICGFLDVVAGNVLESSFAEIWRTAPLFLQLRDWSAYQGKCGACEFLKVCSGCRARAYAVTGDYMAPEPFCTYQPRIRAGG